MSTLFDRIADRVGEIFGLPVGTAEGELNKDAIQREANRVFQYEIPNRVAGWAQEGLVDVTVPAGTELIDSTFTSLRNPGGLPARFKSVFDPVLIDGYDIWFTTDPSEFWRRYTKSDTAQSRPSGALYYAAALRLRPIPDQSYTLTLHGIEYRVDDLDTIDVLPDPIEEDWIVWSAAIRLAAPDNRMDILQIAKVIMPEVVDEVEKRNVAAAGQPRFSRRRF